jgi:hypothetical protein
VVLMTGSGDADVAAALLKAGATDFLVKRAALPGHAPGRARERVPLVSHRERAPARAGTPAVRRSRSRAHGAHAAARSRSTTAAPTSRWSRSPARRSRG